MSPQSSAYNRKGWLAAALILAGTVLPWMHSDVRLASSSWHRYRSGAQSRTIKATCNAWTTTLRLGAVSIPLGIAMAGAAILGAALAKYRGAPHQPTGKISVAVTALAALMLLAFVLMLSIAPNGQAGIGTLVSFGGLVWQLVPAAPAEGVGLPRVQCGVLPGKQGGFTGPRS